MPALANIAAADSAQASPSNKTRKIIERYKEMVAEKQPFLWLYNLCGEYVMTRKQFFSSDVIPGMNQQQHVYDDTAINANKLMAAALIGALWPNGAKSFRIGMPFGMDLELQEDEKAEVEEYYSHVTNVMAEHMDNPKAGFMTALEEYMLDQGAFGSSGLYSEEQDDADCIVFFSAVNIKYMVFDESKNGVVDTVYMERQFKLRQLVQQYGYKNIGEKRQKQYDKGDVKTTVKVLQAIEPRLDRDPYGFGTKNMPYASIHIDLETEKTLLESGFNECPISVTRFYKAMGEKYGRCPAMDALPSILEANAIAEASILAREKILDPPMGLLEGSIAGNGVLDTSPGATNVISVSGRIGTGNHRPVEPLYTVTELSTTENRQNQLVEIINNHFYKDRLMDLNNESRMTLGEANIRNELRGQTLNPVYSRQITECLVPTIERVFNAAFRKNLLGVAHGTQEEHDILMAGGTPLYIPDAVQKRMKVGRDCYKIHFISPATRIMQSEELQGIEQTVTFVTNVAGVNPEVIDNIEWDFTTKRIQQLSGAPPEMISSLAKIKKVRAARQQQQAAAAQTEQARAQSETARNAAQAATATQGMNVGMGGTPGGANAMMGVA